MSYADGLAAPLPQKNFGWLRSMPFDLTLIVGVAALALVSGWVVVRWPQTFPTILMLDVWVLGYHHVVATFTRLTFDTDSFRQYKFLVIWLPIIIAIGSVAAAYAIGSWIIASTYLYWQWFHYTRQSYGISRVYQMKADPTSKIGEQGFIYLLPLAGIMYRSYQNPEKFLGMELKCIPVPLWAFQIVFAVSVVVIFMWIFNQFKAIKEGRFALAYFLYMISHFFIFFVGYLVIEDVTFGWLVINIWHNAQYVLFVWMYNNKRFKNGVDPKHRFLSTLSQANYQWLYYTVCLGFSTLVYLAIAKALGAVNAFNSVSMAALIIYQVINFHHYVVDGIIWKVRKKPIRENLGIET